LLVAGLIAACSEEPRGVVLWHAYAGPERAALEELADGWNQSHPDRPISLVFVPYDAFADKLTAAIPNGNGPDLFIYGQDRIGAWAAADMIEPVDFWVDEDTAKRFDRDALVPLAYDGSLWGLPLATKTLALYYRPDLIDHPPTTTDELFALGRDARAHDRYALAYVGSELYGHSPWLFGYGGTIFGEDGKLQIATAEAADAARFARSLVAQGVVPEEVNGQQLPSLFTEGEAEMAISGPWFLGDLEKSDVPWAVTTLPTISATGRPAAPFLTAEGVLMSAHAHDKDAAFAVMDYLTDDASAILRGREARQVVANTAAYDDDRIGGDGALTTFRKQAQVAVPMPATPVMNAVWRPYQLALEDVLHGGDPGDALHDVEHEVTDGP
jgi:arabinogalactan oligomer/maltooligosaccharide transport system substrate-binding protein